MCLVTRQIKPITTKKDLVVYKEISTGNMGDPNKVLSIYFTFVWKRGQLNKTELVYKKQIPYDLVESLAKPRKCPFYDNTAHAFYLKDTRKYTVVYNGFHAFITRKRTGDLNKPSSNEVEKFLIPKGSLIFKDATGLIVSNQMILL